ncbi:MAG: hypothetical protein AAF726_01260 [Planctomycetota bacterium]
MSLPLLLTSALALSQAGPGAHEALDASLPDRIVFDAPGDGTHWVLGHSYKACVDGEGLTFHPFLGGDAPASHATFALSGVSVDAEPLALAPPTVRREGASLILDRGPIVERYDCSLDSVEQLLEVDVQGATGSLRIDVAVRSNLARPSRARAPFRFGGSAAAIDIGEAFALPGDGSKIPVESIRTPTGYAILVPDEVVEAAGDTLVIDPVISSGSLFSNPPRPFAVADVAILETTGTYLVIERAFSATDSDVILYRAPTLSGGTLTFVAAIDFTTENWQEPAIAAMVSTGDLMVVATRGSGSGRRVYARRSSSDGQSVGQPFLVSSPNVEAFDPDIGAETGGPFSLRRFVAVWSNRFSSLRGVYARPIGPNGPVGNALQLNDIQTRASIPAISAGSGETGTFDPQTFRVAFKQTTGIGLESIWSVDLDRNASVKTPRWRVANVLDTEQVSVSSTNELRLPDGSAPFVIAWDSGPFILGDIFAATCANGSVRGDISNVSAMADERRSLEQRRPRVAATREQWFLTYQERELLGEWRTYMCSGGPAPEGFGLAERNQILLDGGTPQTSATLATYYESSGSVLDTIGYAVWINESGATQLEGGYLRQEFGGNVAGVQYCAAATNSAGRRAWIKALGNGRPTSIQRLKCSGAPVGRPCFILTARESGFVPNVGGAAGNLCLGGLGFGRFSNQIGITSTAGTYSFDLDPQSIAQASGTVAAIVGETWHFQQWFRDTSPGGATSNLSNGVAIEFRN